MPGLSVQGATVPAPAPVATAGISCPGSAVTARLRTIPARPVTREARTAEEGAATVAEVAVAAAINAENSVSKPPVFWSAAIRTF